MESIWGILIFDAVAGMFVAMSIGALYHLRWVRRLPSLETLTSPAGPGAGTKKYPRCSVVIAARDEEARIEGTLRHLLAQSSVEVDFIVVDDRSTDRTPEILRRLASEDSRVQIKRVDVLPAGWLGKCHACHLGAAAATGDWILFTDADCWLKPDVLARAILLAERDGVDHVTMAPENAHATFAAKAWHLLFLTSLLNWFSGVNRDRPKSYVGIGAFNLVRTEAYRQCGGYEALRLTVVDDLKLGLLLRRAGKRTRGFLGADDLECHWGSSLNQMVKIMEKNYFAAIDFRLWLVLLGTFFTLLMMFTLVVGLVTGTPAGLVAAFSPLSLLWPAGILARRLGWSAFCALPVPFMFPVFWYALLNSTWLTMRRGGVRWRETFYPLETLRANTVR